MLKIIDSAPGVHYYQFFDGKTRVGAVLRSRLGKNLWEAGYYDKHGELKAHREDLESKDDAFTFMREEYAKRPGDIRCHFDTELRTPFWGRKNNASI